MSSVRFGSERESEVSRGEHLRALVVSSASRSWALPLHSLRETMRPQPVERIEGALDPVLGLAMIRGAPVPVLALSRLFGGPPEPHLRFVTVRAGARDVALAVADVIGIWDLDVSEFAVLPPLLTSVRSAVIEAIAQRDRRLIAVLDAARLLPDETWQRLTNRGGPPA